MSACNQKYQEEATGTPRDKGYAVGVTRDVSRPGYVKFDGYDAATSTLKDAKGFGYKVKSNGTWSNTRGADKMRQKLTNQSVLNDAKSSKIRFKYVAPSEESKQLCKKKFQSATSSYSLT